jgi:hypothetical protein
MHVPFPRHLSTPLTLLVAALAATASPAQATALRMELDNPLTSPFPSDKFTVADGSHNSYRRMAMPKPDCSQQPSSCDDIDVINTLDGFSLQPRITIPFTGSIDLSTVNSDTVYLVNQGDRIHGQGVGERVGINQIAWNAASHTLVLQPDALLREYSRYALVVTDGVRDRAGARLDTSALRQWLAQPGGSSTVAHGAYRTALADGNRLASLGGDGAIAISVFTTQSASADLQKIHLKIQTSHPAPVNFMIGNSGSVRAVFPVNTLKGIEFDRQTSTAPGFTPEAVPTWALLLKPGAVGQVAYGSYLSPTYRNSAGVIPASGTRTGVPLLLGQTPVIVELFLPNGTAPSGGWPVAIFGHGFTDSMYGAPWAVAGELASRGIATAAINVVGHAGGPLGSLTVQTDASAAVVVPAGGRGTDTNGDGVIGGFEGLNALPPQTLISNRDALRQTTIDLMQLVRQIQAGMDVDGDGTADLSKGRIYYAGQSFGGIYGTILTAVEGSIRAAVLNVPGGSVSEVGRLGDLRYLTATTLALREPMRLNLPPSPKLPFPYSLNFDENMPLRNEAPRTTVVAGSVPIQRVLDNSAWAQQSGNPVAYARYLREQPLPGNAARPVIVQFAKGDGTVPNPTTTALLRAGNLADRATYFRNDLAYASTGGAIPKNPHTFLTNLAIPAAAPFARAAQQQISVFFATDGAQVIDPDGTGTYFETPIAGPLPETLNFLP